MRSNGCLPQAIACNATSPAGKHTNICVCTYVYVHVYVYIYRQVSKMFKYFQSNVQAGGQHAAAYNLQFVLSIMTIVTYAFTCTYVFMNI